MITITTTEKWMEFKGLSSPIKGELNKVWLVVTLANKGSVNLSLRFGKIDTKQVIDVPAVEEVRDETGEITVVGKEATFKDEKYFDFYTPVLIVKEFKKTDEEIKAYSYNQAHEDALALLQELIITENTTFSI